MFHRNSSTSSSAKKSPLGEIKSQASQETLSVLSRSMTATSINSSSSINSTFETHWLPNSTISTQKSYNMTLKLKPREIELLRKSWAIVTSNDSKSSKSEAAGGNINNSFNSQAFTSYLFCIQFYNNLMSMDPEIERLVPNVKHQASAFAGVISATINTLEDLSKMKDSLSNLGRLHARILGIDSPYFKTMGNALIKTFQDWFGNSPDKFPIVLEEAWIKLYCFLANSILQGGIDPVIEYNGNGNLLELNKEEAEENVDSFSISSSKPSESILRSTASSRFSDYQSKKQQVPPQQVKYSGTSQSSTNSFGSTFKSKKAKSHSAKDGDCTIM